MLFVLGCLTAVLAHAAAAETNSDAFSLGSAERTVVLREALPDEPGVSKNVLGFDAAPLNEPLVSDRPDFTESTVAVPTGHAQLEGGYTFTYDRENGERTRDHVFPEFLLRVGLVEDLELRVGWQGWSLTDNLLFERDDEGRKVKRYERDDAGTDMDVGFKIHLVDQDGLVPDFAILPALTLPTGAVGKTSGDVDPSVGFIWAYDLTDRLALAGQVTLAVPTSEKGRFFQTAGSVAISYALTDWLGAYAEYFGFYPNDRGTDAAHTVNGGLTFLITDNLQFDILTGFGLNGDADDFFTGAGFVIRF